MRHPGAVVAGPHFAQLVLADFVERPLVGFGIVLDGDLRRHAAHGMNSAPVAGLDQQLHVRAQEMPVHGDLGAVRQHEIGPVPELLDEAEDVVPAAAVQAGGMLAQLLENLVHLEGGKDGLDQHGGANRARAECPARPERTGIRRSTVAPRGGSPSSADRNRARCRGRSALWRCGRRTGRNRTASRTSACRQSGKCFSTRCQPRGRTISTAGFSPAA